MPKHRNEKKHKILKKLLVVFLISVILLIINIFNIDLRVSDEVLFKCINSTFYATDVYENVFYDEISKISLKLLNLDIKNPMSLIGAQLAVAMEVAENPQDESIDPQSDIVVQTDVKQVTITSKAPIEFKNETSYTFNSTDLLNSDLSFELNKTGPQILIVHTHATEAYYGVDRSFDDSINVVRLGDEITKILNNNGIEVLHIKKHHDQPSYNGSYKNCLESVLTAIKENPSIKIVLDIHRDAISGSALKTVTQIEDKQVAQAMFVVGTDAGGLEHPNWRENLKLAIKLQNKLNNENNNIMRPINIRNERFNQYSAPGHLILEIGGNGNTVDEAVETSKIIGNTLVDLYIKGF